VGDFDDILMFTTRSSSRPFVGRASTLIVPSGTIQSDVAEVAWFVRGRTLYRRVLLVVPWLKMTIGTQRRGFYSWYDVSARAEGTPAKLVANTLGDLSRRECRFARRLADNFPFNASVWCWNCPSASGATLAVPTLPTLHECSSTLNTNPWTLGSSTAPATTPNISPLDFWTNDNTKRLSDIALYTSTNGTRIADDIILTYVIGFDVKAWDPTVNAYVDLGYANAPYSPPLANGLGHFGHPKSGLNAADANHSRVYDTYSTHYENISLGAAQPAGTMPGQANNGFDDDGNGIVDDIGYTGASNTGENITAPPYPVPLRGIQVKIRVFEPDSRTVREVTVVQDFLPQ
jgi:hypothetical protein